MLRDPSAVEHFYTTLKSQNKTDLMKVVSFSHSLLNDLITIRKQYKTNDNALPLFSINTLSMG